jgi:predicted transglutaminase-like cysteine proteinase
MRLLVDGKSYDSYPAPPNDELLPKWRGTQTLDQPMLAPELVLDSYDLAGLQKFNASVNKSITYDELESGAIWKTPAQTWNDKRGNCKDYASLKYNLLCRQGAMVQNIMVLCGELAVGLMKDNPQHAFVILYMIMLKDWYVLDSKFDQLVLLRNYINFVPLKGCTGDQVLLFGRNFTLNDAGVS